MPLLDLFWAMLWFFLFFAWIWLLISIFADIFRSDDLGGWAKAFWTIFVVILPLLGVLVYLIARGGSMQERAMADNRLVPHTIVDLTPETLPYWELRATSSLVTGIEEAFIESYRDGSFQYILIAADRV